jgi:hypothetical protein
MKFKIHQLTARKRRYVESSTVIKLAARKSKRGWRRALNPLAEARQRGGEKASKKLCAETKCPQHHSFVLKITVAEDS